MKHRLTLDYQLGEGRLRPFLEGLREGSARARDCPSSGRVTFPPEGVSLRNNSDNDRPSSGWKTLSGACTILCRTTGAGGAFALVRFDGADNLAVCRIADPADEGKRAMLIASESPQPALTIRVLSTDSEGEHFETID